MLHAMQMHPLFWLANIMVFYNLSSADAFLTSYFHIRCHQLEVDVGNLQVALPAMQMHLQISRTSFHSCWTRTRPPD